MAKGMTLEEFRNQSEGEFQKRKVLLETENQSLKKQLREKDRLIVEEQDELKSLQIKCFLMTKGDMCQFCLSNCPIKLEVSQIIQEKPNSQAIDVHAIEVVENRNEDVKEESDANKTDIPQPITNPTSSGFWGKLKKLFK